MQCDDEWNQPMGSISIMTVIMCGRWICRLPGCLQTLSPHISVTMWDLYDCQLGDRLGGVVVSVSDSWSKGRGFDSRPAHRQATTLGRLLKPCPHCRRKVRPSQKTARKRRQSHFSATVWQGLTPMCLCSRRSIIWYLATAFMLTRRMWLPFVGPMNNGSIYE